LKAHGWLRQITVPNSGPRTTADNDDDSPDQPDATDFDDADADDNNDSQGGAVAFQGDFANSLPMSSNSSTSSLKLPDRKYHQFIDPQQEDICLQTLGLQPASLSTFEEGYALNDIASQPVHISSDWNLKVGCPAPVMEQSFSAPGRMAMRW
jgi:hypothetical protein